MKWTLAIAVTLLLLIAAPAHAGSFGVSPSQVELEIPAQGEASVEFTFSGFSGDILVSTEDIPLRISPQTATLSAGNDKLVLTIYSNESISQTYEGKILFATVGSEINLGLKVKARVTNAGTENPWGGRGHIIGLSAVGVFVLGGAIFLKRRARGAV